MYMVENVRRYELRFEVEWPKRWREINRLNLENKQEYHKYKCTANTNVFLNAYDLCIPCCKLEKIRQITFSAS